MKYKKKIQKFIKLITSGIMVVVLGFCSLIDNVHSVEAQSVEYPMKIANIDTVADTVTLESPNTYEINIKSEGTLRLTLNGNGYYQDVEITVLDAEQYTVNAVGTQEGKVTVKEKTRGVFEYKVKKGVYGIKVSGSGVYGDGSASYTLQTMFEPDLALNYDMEYGFEPIEIDNIETISSSVSRKETHIYKIEVQSQGTLNIALRGLGNYQNVYMSVISLRDGTIRDIVNNDYEVEVSNREAFKYNIESGTYYIKISGLASYDEKTAYTLETLFSPADIQTENMTMNFEVKEISFSDTVSEIINNKESHIYHLKMTKKGNVEITLSGNAYNQDLYLTLFNLKKGIIKPIEGNSEETLVSWKSSTTLKYQLDKGDYYIKISGSCSYGSAKYVLTPIKLKIIYGDVNNDGLVNTQDAVLLKKYLAGYQNLGIDEEASDVNCDGKISSADVVLLLKKLAGYDVKLGE